MYVNVAEASSNSVESTPGTTPDGRAHGRTLSGDGSGPRAAKTGAGGIPHHPTPRPHSGRPGSRPGSRSGPHSGRPGLANQNSRRYDTTELLRSLGSIDYDTARRSMADDVADGTVTDALLGSWPLQRQNFFDWKGGLGALAHAIGDQRANVCACATELLPAWDACEAWQNPDAAAQFLLEAMEHKKAKKDNE